MKQWNIQVTWESNGTRVMDVQSDNPIPESIDPVTVAEQMVAVLPVMSHAGKQAMLRNRETYDSRITTFIVANEGRSRSLRVVQHENMTDEEAERCTELVMEWLFSDETTNLLMS